MFVGIARYFQENKTNDPNAYMSYCKTGDTKEEVAQRIFDWRTRQGGAASNYTLLIAEVTDTIKTPANFEIIPVKP